MSYLLTDGPKGKLKLIPPRAFSEVLKRRTRGWGDRRHGGARLSEESLNFAAWIVVHAILGAAPNCYYAYGSYIEPLGVGKASGRRVMLLFLLFSRAPDQFAGSGERGWHEGAATRLACAR
jgi:hypothetical protein